MQSSVKSRRAAGLTLVLLAAALALMWWTLRGAQKSAALPEGAAWVCSGGDA